GDVMASSADARRPRGISRLAWWAARAQNNPGYPRVLGPMIRALQSNHPKADIDLVVRAYKVAEVAHRGQTRKSGDGYITHPLAVATILAEIGMPPVTLAAALLHDTVEATSYWLDELPEEFGSDAAARGDAVTTLDKLTYGPPAPPATV